MRIRPRHLVIGTASLVAVGAIAGGTAWALSGDDDSFTRGNCTTASYEFEVEDEENDRLEVNLELLAAQVGEEWSISISQDGTSLFNGTRIADEDAEVDVDLDTAAGDGTTFTAEFGPVGAKPCRVELSH